MANMLGCSNQRASCAHYSSSGQSALPHTVIQFLHGFTHTSRRATLRMSPLKRIWNSQRTKQQAKHLHHQSEFTIGYASPLWGQSRENAFSLTRTHTHTITNSHAHIHTHNGMQRRTFGRSINHKVFVFKRRHFPGPNNGRPAPLLSKLICITAAVDWWFEHN